MCLYMKWNFKNRYFTFIPKAWEYQDIEVKKRYDWLCTCLIQSLLLVFEYTPIKTSFSHVCMIICTYDDDDSNTINMYYHYPVDYENEWCGFMIIIVQVNHKITNFICITDYLHLMNIQLVWFRLNFITWIAQYFVLL